MRKLDLVSGWLRVFLIGSARGARGRLERVLCALVLAAVIGSAGPALSATIGVREQGTGLTEVSAEPGETVSLELFVDTEGLSFEGYMIGIDITGGGVSGLSVSHQNLSGLHPDLFGPMVIDEGLGTIRSINQSTFSTGLGDGTYVLNVITLTVDTYASNSDPEIWVTPGLFGESLGLEGGACPGNVPGCTVSLSSASLTVVAIPEPSTALSLGLGLIGLRIARRRMLGNG